MIETPFDLKKLIISLLGALVVGFGGSYLASFSGGIWYSEVASGGSLPLWLESHIWIGLSLLAGIAFYRAWQRGMGVSSRKAAVGVYIGIQLALNPIWSGVGSGMEGPFLSLIKWVISMSAVLYILVRFSSKDKIAGVLLWPYVLWVALASAPNLTSRLFNLLKLF